MLIRVSCYGNRIYIGDVSHPHLVPHGAGKKIVKNSTNSSTHTFVGHFSVGDPIGPGTWSIVHHRSASSASQSETRDFLYQGHFENDLPAPLGRFLVKIGSSAAAFFCSGLHNDTVVYGPMADKISESSKLDIVGVDTWEDSDLTEEAKSRTWLPVLQQLVGENISLADLRQSLSLSKALDNLENIKAHRARSCSLPLKKRGLRVGEKCEERAAKRARYGGHQY